MINSSCSSSTYSVAGTVMIIMLVGWRLGFPSGSSLCLYHTVDDTNLHYLEDPKLWQLWYIPF